MKKKIKVWDYAGQILEAVGTGALVTVKVGDKVNPMTIGWGTLGIEWGKPIFTVFIRESRFTKGLLEESGEFTISIPMDDPRTKEILKLCGTKSGRDLDKVAELGLTLEEPQAISTPGIRQLPLTLECKVIYKQKQDPDAINEEATQRYYPTAGGTGDYHTAYYGQIMAAYIIE